MIKLERNMTSMINNLNDQEKEVCAVAVMRSMLPNLR